MHVAAKLKGGPAYDHTRGSPFLFLLDDSPQRSALATYPKILETLEALSKAPGAPSEAQNLLAFELWRRAHDGSRFGTQCDDPAADYQRAAALWASAAQAGNTEAQRMVGLMWAPYDEEEAVRWLSRAAKGGDEGAANALDELVLRRLEEASLEASNSGKVRR